MAAMRSDSKVKCKRCGFLCDASRDITGGKSRISHQRIAVTSTVDSEPPVWTFRADGTIKADGSARAGCKAGCTTTRYVYDPVVTPDLLSAQCPFCGTKNILNWRR